LIEPLQSFPALTCQGLQSLGVGVDEDEADDLVGVGAGVEPRE
jgi:hypothetical protein